MKKYFVIFFAGIISFGFMSNSPADKGNSAAVVSTRYMDVNNISAVYRNNGSYNREPVTGYSGFEWPKGSGKYARWASGIWLGCISGGDTLTAAADYGYDYAGGYIDNNGNPQTDSTYRIFSFYRSDLNSYDYINWPFEQGAYATADGKPYILGDQTMFSSMTDGFPHGNGSSSLRSLNAQILFTSWAYSGSFPQGLQGLYADNTIFMEYRIINRSDEIWNASYVSLWTSDYLGGPSDMRYGCDTTLELAYSYNTYTGGEYSPNAPSAGMMFLKGMEKLSGNAFDTVRYYQPFGSNVLIKKIGYKDAGMSVFNAYQNGAPQPSDPINSSETYRIMKGLWRLPFPQNPLGVWVNPLNGDTTTTPFSGDPVTGTGWTNSPTFRASLLSTGPGVVNPGDTITIIAAQLIDRSTASRLSVQALKNSAARIKRFYENNLKPFPDFASPAVSSNANGNGKITLTWDDSSERINYPNPISGGTYYFQGYNIYQINSYSTHPSSSDTILIKTFDRRDGINNIYDSVYIPSAQGFLYGIVQYGNGSGITHSYDIYRDTISRKDFINGTQYKFAVTAYYYDSLGGVFSLPKVRQSPKGNIISVTPQKYSSGNFTDYNTGDTIITDQKDLAVMPLVISPQEMQDATYTSVFGGTVTHPTFTLIKNMNGITSILTENNPDFGDQQNGVFMSDGLQFVHQVIRDSGVVRDYGSVIYDLPPNTLTGSWTYEPSGKEWFTAPDTTAIKTAKIISNRQFQSRSLGMSFPTTGTFRNNITQVKANGSSFRQLSAGSPILTGGPLRKIKIIFGQSSMAYRYVPLDTNFVNTPYADMVSIPFSVYAADELDSSAGALRQLNTGFMDRDNDGQWDPDTSSLGNYHFTYIMASSYDPKPHPVYTSKNPGLASPTSGFPAIDIMYAWLPRAGKENGTSKTWGNGEVLTVSPYRITKPEFVPGYPLKYSWSVKGYSKNVQAGMEEIKKIKVFPNPYYGFSELEYNDAQEKFIYISHLPMKATIYIYSLDGVPVKKINRDSNDPSSSLEKWDLKNNDGSYVASGMYIVYVDCGEFGVKTLKIAVFQR